MGSHTRGWIVGMTRARVVSVFTGLVVVVVAASCTTSGGASDGWLDVGSEAAIRAAGVTYRADLRTFVVATDSSIVALSDGTQHLEGERVLYCAARDGFVGPHAESFDREGRYVGGPAASDMDMVAVRVYAGLVSIDPGQITVTPERSVGASPSSGARCDGSEDPAGFVHAG